jgi:hypothetical protein
VAQKCQSLVISMAQKCQGQVFHVAQKMRAISVVFKCHFNAISMPRKMEKYALSVLM